MIICSLVVTTGYVYTVLIALVFVVSLFVIYVIAEQESIMLCRCVMLQTRPPAAD